MILLALALAAAAPPRDALDRADAVVALRAAVAAMDSGKVEVDCYPNSLYRDDEPCGASEATIRRLDPDKLRYFDIKPCTIFRMPPARPWRTKCIRLGFDRGRGDGGITTLELAIGRAGLRTAADIKAIKLSQEIASR